MIFIAAQIILQVRDRDKYQSVFLCHGLQLFSTHHGTVFPHDLAAQTALGQTGQTAQIHRCLRVSVAHQHTAMPCRQRKYMPRPPQI